MPMKPELSKTATTQAGAEKNYYTLPELPWAKDALQPNISKETIEYHYGKHHKDYVDKLNKLIVGTEFENQPIEEVIKKAKGPLFNNAAQAWNHTFFWNCLTPQAKALPKGELATAIDQAFGSMEEFKAQFSKQAEELFGSGWAWLVRGADGKLAIQALSNADTPIAKGITPILTLDVWEHAYYIDYRNVRKDFIQNFWNIANWEFAAKNFAENLH